MNASRFLGWLCLFGSGLAAAPHALAQAPGGLSTAGPGSASPAAVTAVAAPDPFARPGLRITVFAMGQADAMLVVGRGKTLLVDCGSPVDDDDPAGRQGHQRVAQAIRAATSGRGKLDALVISHFHEDHTGRPGYGGKPGTGLFGLIDGEGITVDTVYDHGSDYPRFGRDTDTEDDTARAIARWRREGKVQKRETPALGAAIDLGGSARAVIASVNGSGALERAAAQGRFTRGRAPNENDYSLALVIGLGAFEMFSGGDLSGEDTFPRPGKAVYTDVEAWIAQRVGNVEVLRANHHGSRHSSSEAFLRTLRPEVTLVSCGDENPHGHPARAAVDRLRGWGPIFATSGLARDWLFEADAPEVEGELTLSVTPGGERYRIQGDSGLLFESRSYSRRDESAGADHPLAPRP